MGNLRRFSAMDLLYMNNVNLDFFTETYNLGFYFEYLCRWPECFYGMTSADGQLMAYVMGKVEGAGPEWHGHVTAVTVSPQFRRIGCAQRLMDLLETMSDRMHEGFFVDLFVRCSNRIAIDMYERMGYRPYRRVLHYYTGPHPEDAFDMRKALSSDPQRLSERPYPRAVSPEELDSTMSLPA